ncbi:MAG TPA: LysM peptidoglycan-binding domain-containing protein, partial [Phenylobacterium sp.]|uniref:LysM peptidoglycan-binding domain-containing protein n=1 Tax=Phenylobacterium sp. TaxID=1871053 RepID=UPI002F93B6CD
VDATPLPSLTPSRPATPPPASRPQAMQTVTRTSVAGKVVEAEGPAKDYTVKSGDNLDAIARTLGTTRKQLADDNDLKAPYALRPGQVLKGPASSKAKAYVVGSGDTLYAIAGRFSVSAAAIAEANDRDIHAPLSIGQRLILPEGFKDKGPTTTRVQVPVSSGTFDEPPPARSEPPPRMTQPAPPPVEEPPARPTVRTRVTGKVVDTTGKPQSYKVKKGDNLDAIARSLDTTRKQLADDNKLKAPYALQPGQTLQGPPTKAKAYVAGPDDTMALIAKRFGVTQKALAGANGLRVGASIRPGRQVILPAGYRDRGPIREEVAPPAPPSSTPTPVPTPPPSTSSYPKPTTPPPSQPSSPPVVNPPAAGTPTDAQISSFGRGRFIWPLRGDVISGFGPKGTGQRNDGVNVRASAGSTVRSAAAGDVVYAGDQVPGFGNLVLIKHTDGWVTAYGHLSRVDVKMQQKVVQGQQIGQAGSTGGVSEPQLHFEVRYAPTPQDRARPVDPLLVLPK